MVLYKILYNIDFFSLINRYSFLNILQYILQYINEAVTDL